MAAYPGRSPLLETCRVTAWTVLISAVGGGAFALLGFPAPLISGGMVAVAAAAIAGFRVAVPAPLREVVFFVLGVSIGSALSPASLVGIATWPLSIVLMVLTVPLITLCAGYLLIRRGWPRDDALLATAPGALSSVLIVAHSIGANVSRVALVQTLRLAILVVLLPLIVRLYTDVPTMSFSGVADNAVPLRMTELGLVVVAGLAGAALAALVRLPAASLVGAMIGSGALYLGGAVAAPMPDFILLPGLVVVGAFIGSRFTGMTLAHIRVGLVDGLYAFAAAFAISVAIAGLVTLILGISFADTVLDFAPGGFEVMIVLAFSLGLDAAYVALHQTVRFVAVAIAAPVWFLKRRREK